MEPEFRFRTEQDSSVSHSGIAGYGV
jgi:hypothetical protein